MGNTHVCVDRKVIMQHILEAMGTPFTTVELTPLSARLLEERHIPFLDAVLCFVLPRLDNQTLSEVSQAHLDSLRTLETHPR